MEDVLREARESGGDSAALEQVETRARFAVIENLAKGCRRQALRHDGLPVEATFFWVGIIRVRAGFMVFRTHARRMRFLSRTESV